MKAVHRERKILPARTLPRMRLFHILAVYRLGNYGQDSAIHNHQTHLLPVDAPQITREAVEQALQSLTGEREQLPPLYSAKKVQGVRAYEFARAGEEIELKKALVNIYELELLEYDMPRIKIRVRCSKGTYIRSLAFEIGEALQSGAYLSSLRRTRSGGFVVDRAHTLDDFMEKLRECETK